MLAVKRMGEQENTLLFIRNVLNPRMEFKYAKAAIYKLTA